MQKVIVIGCPGSGKSTFSKALHQKTTLPLVHLDNLFWNANKTTVEKSVFLEKLSHVLAQEQWIIDGNYASTMERRLQACDTVFFLDYPMEICLHGIAERKGKPRSDMPWVETADDEAFLEFIKNYAQNCRPQVLELLSRYAHKDIFVFTARTQADAFIAHIK